MTSCAHQQWLRINEAERGYEIQYGNRLHYITTSFPRPSEQYPSFIFFIGAQLKTKILRSVFPGNTISNCRKYGIANICVSPTTMNDQYPILLADSCPNRTQLESKKDNFSCHETTKYTMKWPDGQSRQSDLTDYIQARLFSLFINVLCIFSQDCGGLEAVAEILAAWIANGSASSLPNSVRPRLLIATNIRGSDFESEALCFRLRILAEPGFSEVFSSLNIVNIIGTNRPTAPGYFSGFGEVLHEETRLARTQRIDTHTLFSIAHTTAFFDLALRRFASTPSKLFNFIRSSREDNPVSSNFSHRIKAFLTLCLEHSVPDNVPWDFIASVVILNSLPPDMHQFNPAEIFRTIYRQECSLGIRDYALARHLDIDLICAEIECHIISMFSQMKRNGKTAIMLHQKSLEHHSYYLQLFQHTTLCLVCLQNNLEHHTECGHTMCDTCVRIFGVPTKGLEYFYDLTTCLSCRRHIRFQARILPPTCRVRFLAMDGGGIRGIVTLGFLEELRRALGLTSPIQENFDFSIGTSTGGIENLGLFRKGWTPLQNISFILSFAKIVFRKDSFIRCCVNFFIRDGKYDSAILEDVLKEKFGSTLMFGSSSSTPSGMKVAVTATTISDARLCLITNYNGETDNNVDAKYKILRAKKVSEEILLWEAARCTTAAPSPKYLRSFGTFQDGAMKNNNPVRPGLEQVRRIWKDTSCDIVLSIGTGYEKNLHSPIATNVRNLFQDGALARFYRAAMQSLSMNAQLSWEDHWHGLEDTVKKQHFRLNLPLKGREPQIDDVDKMQYLYDEIRHHLGDIEGIVRAFKAVTFFFELDVPLILEAGLYKCNGSILSRSPDSRAFVRNLVDNYPDAHFKYNDVSLGSLSMNDICRLCGRFQKEITFYIRHPSDQVDLQLVFNRLFRRSISAFPQSIEWFIERQKLNVKFGQASHKSNITRVRESDCVCEKERRRNKSLYVMDEKKRALNSRLSTRNKRHCP